MSAQAEDLPLRVGLLEQRWQTVENRSKTNSKRLSDLERDVAVAKQINQEVGQDILELKATLNKLIWAVVALAMTIAGSAIGIAITAGVTHP